MPRAAGAAAALQEELGIDATLIKGRGGIFEVKVDGRLVAKKTYEGFPTEDEVVEAVRAALG
ncbi:MAG: selenocysteine-containing [Deltaproteobacteria bacterium]|nr:MAG: selenocysteine-containing [Deltaproteobacteria bacterium]